MADRELIEKELAQDDLLKQLACDNHDAQLKIIELSKQLTATQQALDSAVEALKWQPIKSAPKNGSSILIGMSHFKVEKFL